MMPAPRRSPHSISHPGLRRVSRIKGRTHVSTRPRATPLLKISLAPQGASTHVAKFWCLPRVEPAGVSAPPNRRWPVILNALVEKLKRRSKADFKGRHFEATLILQAVSWYLRYPLSYRD